MKKLKITYHWYISTKFEKKILKKSTELLEIL